MQDIQNIPNPDVNSTEDDFDNHPTKNQDIEQPENDIPVPPDTSRTVPIEEPPTEQDKPPITEDQTEPKQLV